MAETMGRLRVVRFGYKVVNHDIDGKCLEAVGKPLRDIELVAVHARKLKPLPVAISRRAGPDVDDDVPNGSVNATHQFHFAVWIALIVHASQSSSARRVRNAVLRIAGLKPVGRELFNTEGASEEATVVAHRLQVNEPNITKRCWVKLHRTTSTQSNLACLMVSRDVFAQVLSIGLIWMSVTSAVRGKLRAFSITEATSWGCNKSSGR